MSVDLTATETVLERLVAFPTVSHLPNLEMIGHAAELLRNAGARVEVLTDASGTKANLWATLGPERDGGIVLSGHSDVVPVEGQDWTVPAFALTERDDRLYGRGTCDMKGFIAAVLARLPALKGMALHRPVHVALTHDEEIGCLGAQALIPELKARAIRPAMAIVGEPTGMQIIDGHKGCCEYTVRFRGLAGHGSAPDKGVNAVTAAVRYAAHLLEQGEALKARAPRGSRFDPPHTTVNIGALHGGTAHNVIPEHAVLDWEMRPVVWDDADFVTDRMTRYVQGTLLPQMRAVCADAAVETQTIGQVVGLEPMEQNAVRDLVAALTGCNTAETVPFNTEAGLFQQLGLSVVVCGPGHIAHAHKPDEYLERAQLAQCVTMLDGLFRQLVA